MKKKKQGFQGERILELSQEHQDILDYKEMISFSRIGYFPKAKFQFEESNNGHSYHILVYCIQGCGKFNINNKTYDIRAGEFFFVPKEKAYSYYADIQKPWSIYWFQFNGNSCDGILKLFYENTGSFKGLLKYNEERIQLFDVIYKNLKRGYSKNILMLLSMSLLHFLSSLALHIKVNPKKEDKNQEIVNTAIAFMSSNLDAVLSLNTLVSHLNISVSYFSALFKKKTGIPPLEYFNQLKIQKACEYLEFTDMLIKEIAFKLGVEDAQYFSRLFFKITGMSPNAYRKMVFKR